MKYSLPARHVVEHLKSLFYLVFRNIIKKWLLALPAHRQEMEGLTHLKSHM